MKVLSEHIAAFVKELEVNVGQGAVHWHFIEVEVYRMTWLPEQDGFFYDPADPLSTSIFNMN